MRGFFLIAATALTLCEAFKPASAQARGVSLTAMSRIKRTADGWQYDPLPVFSGKFFRDLRAAGVDNVRLTVRPLAMLQGSQASKDNARSQIIRMARAILLADISVVIDMHPWPPDSNDDQAALICNPVLAKQYSVMLTSLAISIKTLESHHISLELLNEPRPCSINGRVQWPYVQKNLYDAIREIAPTLDLVVTAPIGQLNDLLKMDPSPYVKDPHVAFSFHFYDPWRMFLPLTVEAYQKINAFTSNRYSDNKVSSLSLSLSEQDALTSQNRSISARINKAVSWARRYNIKPSRVFVGEFGMVMPSGDSDPTRRASQLLWNRAVADAVDISGFQSSYWFWPVYNHYDYDPDFRSLRSDVAHSVGLKSFAG